MKKLVSLLVFFSLFLACSSNDDGGNMQDDEFIRFAVNGQTYDYEPATITSLQVLIQGEDGVNDTYRSISLWMPLTRAVGTHTIIDDSPSNTDAYTANYESAGENIYMQATSGTLTITSITSDYIEGTFSFSGDHNGTTLSIANGQFKAFN